MDTPVRVHRKDYRSRSQATPSSVRSRRRPADVDAPIGSTSSATQAENVQLATRSKKRSPGTIAALASSSRLADEDAMSIDRRSAKPRASSRRAVGEAARGSTPFLDLHQPLPASRARLREKARGARENNEDIGERLAPTYSGGIAVAEFERMKSEVESLKKRVQDDKKLIRKQRETITKLESEREQRAEELKRLKTDSIVNEEIISTFEHSMQCTICMEPMLKPYALPPCGHVYCYACLQSWFIKAPAHEDDMVDDGEEALLHRRKSCPSCRAAVIGRPVPLFLVKSLAGALMKSRGPDGRSKTASPPPNDEDPWNGIFYPLEDDWSDDGGSGESESDSDESEESEEDSDDDDVQRVVEYRYGTPSDIAADQEIEYAHASWAPPSLRVSPHEYDLAALRPVQISLLRRGATLPMIERFGMRYTHGVGISARLRPRHTVFIGWNISLHPEDPLGTEYMAWVDHDIDERPERWETQVDANGNGTVTSWRLEAVVDNDELDWDTTDSEAYLVENEEEDELDMFR